MKITQLMDRPLPQIPDDIKEALTRNDVTLTEYEYKNQILIDENLQNEVGYKFFKDGSALVSMTCPMPGITPEMINWWFWWHPQSNDRYQVWYPGEHFKNSYAKKDTAYFKQDTLPSFKPNNQYPRERIGSKTATLVIKFKKPEDMGFDCNLMAKNNFPVIVCGDVGVKHLFMHTEMTHMFKQTNDGLTLVSRFWMGKLIKNEKVRRTIITEDMVRAMAKHCCIEYRSLAYILPILYEEYANNK